MEHGGDLSAGRRALRVKQIAGFSLYKAAADRPLHRRLCVIRDLVRVLELVQVSLDGQIVALVVCVAVEDGCKLFAGDGIVRAKLVFAVARENAVLRRPCDRVSVPFPASTSVKLFLPFGTGLPSMRQRMVAIMPRVAVPCGLNRVSLVPSINPFS